MTIKEQIKDPERKAIYDKHVRDFLRKTLKQCEKEVKKDVK